MHLKAEEIESVETEKVLEDSLSRKRPTFMKEHGGKAFSLLFWELSLWHQGGATQCWYFNGTPQTVTGEENLNFFKCLEIHKHVLLVNPHADVEKQFTTFVLSKELHWGK